MGEEWKQYQPYPSYWVSTLGNVKRIYKKIVKNIYLNPQLIIKVMGKLI